MKVLHIQHSMPMAGNAAYRLHCAMRENGIDSCMLTLYPSAQKPHSYSHEKGRFFFWGKIINHFYSTYETRKKMPDSYFYHGLTKIGRGLPRNFLVKEADVIYFHWIATGCISLSEIETIAKTGKLLVFFMHDMWDFTGGCHHSLDCNQYKTGCRECPMFTNHNSLVKFNIESKARLYKKYKNIVFVSPSQWMTNCAKQSYCIDSNRVYNIPNVVDEKVFKPIGKEYARNILNLPQDKKIITFGCQASGNNYKGWGYLRDAVNMLERDDIHIVVYGSEYNEQTAKEVKYPISFLGHISDDRLLAIISNVADVFVNPSLCENYSGVLLEHILCGTPVIGFNYTGIPDLVKTGVTGYLAKYKDSKDLAVGINYVLDHSFTISGYQNYSSKDIINRHISELLRNGRQSNC